jgi:uracil-DNA glycosylase
LGDRSNPSSAMNANCPSRFLLAELRILRPRVLIVFGAAAREGALSAIRTIDEAEPHWPHKTRSGYGRRESRVEWGPLDVLGMWHPTYARWPDALQALIADLAAHPLGAGPEAPE